MSADKNCDNEFFFFKIRLLHIAGLTELTSRVACMLKLKIKSKASFKKRGKWAISTVFFQVFLCCCAWLLLMKHLGVSCLVWFWFFLPFFFFSLPESSGSLKPLWQYRWLTGEFNIYWLSRLWFVTLNSVKKFSDS